MRPGDFYELSRYLALRLEEAIQGGAGESLIPVFLAHPVDIPKAESGQGPRAALYLHRIIPSSTYREAGVRIQSAADPALPGRVSRSALWLELRFVFMIIEATSQEELGAIASAVEFLHSNALLSVEDMEACLAKELSIELGELPLELVEDAGLWQELGFSRHHLGVSFKVTLPAVARPGEEVERVVEREISLEQVLEKERK